MLKGRERRPTPRVTWGASEGLPNLGLPWPLLHSYPQIRLSGTLRLSLPPFFSKPTCRKQACYIFFQGKTVEFFFSWIKVFSWKLLCKVNESRIYPVYEAKKLAPPCRLTHQVSSPTWDHNPDSHPLFISPTYPRLSEGFQRAEIKNHSLQELITNRVKYYLFCDVLIMTEEQISNWNFRYWQVGGRDIWGQSLLAHP